MGVVGIGGIAFRAADPESLRAWYAEHLGVGEHGEWETEARPSVFAPVSALAAAGIDVVTDPDWDMPGVGRFARLQDPEGNPIELWEPKGEDAARPPVAPCASCSRR